VGCEKKKKQAVALARVAAGYGSNKWSISKKKNLPITVT
jgi:hypothetical protein